MDKEIFDLNEFQHDEEFVNFKAEDYRLKEHIKENMEDFKVREFSNSSSNSKDGEHKESSLDDLKDQLNDTSSTGPGATSGGASNAASNVAGHTLATSVSVTSIGGLVITAVAGTSIITGNNILSSEEKNPSSSETPEIVLPVPGNLEYKNSLIQYHINEQGEHLQNIIFYTSGSLNEGFNAILSSETINKTAPLINNQFAFNDIPEKETNFLLNFYDSNNQLIESKDIYVPHNNVYSENHFINDNYLITSNNDGTINLYSQFESTYNGVFYNDPKLRVIDDLNDYDFKPIIKEGYTIFKDIPLNDIQVESRPYLYKDNNYYTYGSYAFEPRSFYLTQCNVSGFIVDDMLTFEVNEEFINDIILDITFEDNTTQKEVVTKAMLDKSNTCKIRLNKISNNVKVNITLDKVLPNTFNGRPLKEGLKNQIIGESYLTLHEELNITSQINDKLELDYVVMADENYLNDDSMMYQDYSPIILYFKGRLKNEATSYIVEAIDSSGNVLAEHTNEEFKSLGTGILFKTTKLNQDYTFKYYIKDDYEKKLMGEITYKVGEKPADLGYGDGSLGVYPSGCLVTYNNDNTYNIYNAVDYYNPENEDIYGLFDIYNVNDLTTPIDSFITNKPWSRLDIPMKDKLTCHALILAKRGNVYYTLTAAYNDSSPIGPILNANGKKEIKDIRVNVDETSKIATFTYDGDYIASDVKVTYQIEGEQSKSLIINVNDINVDKADTYNSIFTVNLETGLPRITKVNFIIEGEVMANEPFTEEDYLTRFQVQTKGSLNVPFITNYDYYAAI